MSQSIRSAERPQAEGQHLLPRLPYALNALEPHISKSTLEFHYGKHHAGYVRKLNELVRDSVFAHATLEQLVRLAPPGPLFNNAAQAWNHEFYWNSLGPHMGDRPSGTLAKAIARAFGSFDSFRAEFTQRASALFGSGWMWLVRNPDGSLALEETANADTPIRSGRLPLLVCDVWEHAYYLDYRNERARHLDAYWQVVNWDTVARRYGGDARDKS